MRRQCAKVIDQWALVVAGRLKSLAGRPHFAASHELASWASSPGGGNTESEAGDWWKLHLVAARPRG
jgi:hypothetical protein